jgi:hypothetical protein
MENMKSLADRLREELVKPSAGNRKAKTVRPGPLAEEKVHAILEAIQNFDTSLSKSMVHVRFDSRTVDTMNKFKMATNVDVTRFVAFAVKHLFDTHPEIKTIIKNYLQNTEL